MNLTKAKEFFVPGEQRRRLLMTVLGVVIAAIAVSFFKQAAFGVDPFQCLCSGLDNVIPIGFGTLYVLINVALLSVALILDRHYIGIATFINLFLTGYIAEYGEKLIYLVMGDPTMITRVIYLVIGVVVICVASALYFTADLGVSTYDFIALYLSKRQKKIPFRFIRIFTDLICVLIGFSLGAIPGVGTIITAFFMGPLISFFNRTVAEPLRHGKAVRS